MKFLNALAQLAWWSIASLHANPVAVEVEVIEISSSDFQELDRTNYLGQHLPKLRDHLQEWVHSGKAKLIESARAEGKAGEKIEINSGHQKVYATEIDAAQGIPEVVLPNGRRIPELVVGPHPTSFEQRFLGLAVEARVSVLDRRLVAEYRIETNRLLKMNQWYSFNKGDGEEHIEMPCAASQSLVTSFQQEQAAYTFLGMLEPRDKEGKRRADVKHLFFSRVWYRGRDEIRPNSVQNHLRLKHFQFDEEEFTIDSGLALLSGDELNKKMTAWSEKGRANLVNEMIVALDRDGNKAEAASVMQYVNTIEVEPSEVVGMGKSNWPKGSVVKPLVLGPHGNAFGEIEMGSRVSLSLCEDEGVSLLEFDSDLSNYQGESLLSKFKNKWSVANMTAVKQSRLHLKGILKMQEGKYQLLGVYDSKNAEAAKGKKFLVLCKWERRVSE